MVRAGYPPGEFACGSKSGTTTNGWVTVFTLAKCVSASFHVHNDDVGNDLKYQITGKESYTGEYDDIIAGVSTVVAGADDAKSINSPYIAMKIEVKSSISDNAADYTIEATAVAEELSEG